MAKSDQAQRRAAKERFAIASRLEREYARQLRYLTRHIDHLVKGMVDQPEDLVETLTSYSKLIDPWAKSVANKMLLRLASKDEQAWVQMGRDIGRELRKELNEAPTGAVLRQFLDEQVALIKSLPLDAGQRVHKLTLEGLATGRRADAIRKDILETGDVTASRAQLIARTEVARTASGLTMARAQHIGATHYYWRSSSDGDVRESHKKMNGKIIAWNTPPEVDPGKFYHAGMFPNCRCWPQPILPED